MEFIFHRLQKQAIPVGTLFLLLTVCQRTAAEETPGFSRDILPILSENCFRCHGPDANVRKAKLRLDTREGALRVIVPGKSSESELIRRLTAKADDGLMPPPRSNRKLTSEQKVLLRRWVDLGMPWGKHWAYETPRRPELPAVNNQKWCRNAIDQFVLAALEKKALHPSVEATRETLIRRVTLDLTGLPPTLSEIDNFVADTSVDCYEKLVDRLLASSRFGERLAVEWLDAARFADTNGYQNDFARSMWLWRDWVIAAFNQNMPYDQFVVNQIAGDMVPGTTLSQRIASGFNRNNRTVTEGGSIDEEWRVENVVDRVETTTAVFLGLTMGCARCHDHKYDPLTQKDFYRFYAFFNSINEKGVYTEQRGNVPPLVSVSSAEDQGHIKQLDMAINAAQKLVREQEQALPQLQKKWEGVQLARGTSLVSTPLALQVPLNGQPIYIAVGKQSLGVYKAAGPPLWVEGLYGKALLLDGKVEPCPDLGQAFAAERTDKFSLSAWIKPSGDGAILSKMDDARAYRGFDVLVSNNKIAVHLVHHWPDNAIKISTREQIPKDAWSQVIVTYDGSGKAKGVRIYLNGKAAEIESLNDNLSGPIATLQPLRIGRRSTSLAFHGALSDIRFYRQTLDAATSSEIHTNAWLPIIKMPEIVRTAPQKAQLAHFFRTDFAIGLCQAEQRLELLKKQKEDRVQKIASVMVMEELATPRPTHLLKRGRYDMPDRSEQLKPGVPECMTPLPPHVPANRLGLAKWLAEPTNPLTGRVAVNRYWQRFYGIGLVNTPEDFGVRGEMPSHPDLLDWLADEFVRTGWDVKGIQRLMVMSSTYRQSCKATLELIRLDPDNRFLARGPRFRLPAEIVRDNALAISGLLFETIGGPSVKPYQPPGLWEELAGGAGEGPYVQDRGPNLYRRSLYVYRKRTVPHPSMVTFDAPSREICQVKRQRTNTPLQALEILNDVTYVEAARRLAERMLTECHGTTDQRLTFAFRLATARFPSSSELQVLSRALARYLHVFHEHPTDARELVHHGDSPSPADLNEADLAAYTAVASVILNLDETISRE